MSRPHDDANPTPVADHESEAIDFESALEQLEGLVTRMERGEQSLEESLRDYEQGIALARRCQNALEQAEQRVRMVSAEGESAFVVERDEVSR